VLGSRRRSIWCTGRAAASSSSSKRKGRRCLAFIRARIIASVTGPQRLRAEGTASRRSRAEDVPRFRMTSVRVRTLRCSFAGCRASQVAPSGRRCPEGHLVPCPVRRMAGLSRPVARFTASPRWAAGLQGFAFSSPSSLAWPSSCHGSSAFRVSPRLERSFPCWNPRVLAWNEARWFGTVVKPGPEFAHLSWVFLPSRV